MLTIPKCQDHAVCFVDILRIYFRYALSEKTICFLEANSAGVSRYCHKGGGVTYSIQQPNRQAIKVLDRYFRRNRDFMNYLEISLDISTRSFDGARKAAKFFRRHIWHRFSREYFEVYYETCYSKRRGGRKTNFACYPMGYSKVLPKPALHIEWRLRSARVLQRANIARPISLLRLDILNFWQEHWCFLDFSDKDLLSAAQIVAKRNNMAVERIIKMIQISIACDDDGTLSAAGFRLSCQRMGLQPERYVHQIQVRFPKHLRWLLADDNP